MEAAEDDLRAVRIVLAQVPHLIESWIAGLGSARGTDIVSTKGESVTAGKPRMSAAGRARSVESYRRRLSPGVDNTKTLGWWVDADGSKAAREFTYATGMASPPGYLTLTNHVEIQFAMRMRAHALTNETIVIDRPPCGVLRQSEWTCHEKLARFLPPGARLTVITQDGRRVYCTGART